MNKEIAGVLKNRLSADGGLQFVDVLAGLAQKVEYKSENSDGNPVTKRMPVSYDTNVSGSCQVSPETAVVPDSRKKGVLYFEDLGCNFIDRQSGGAMRYRSTFVLVCWMNKARIVGEKYTEITSYCISELLKKLGTKKITNEGGFSRFRVTPGRILPQDAAVFSRYTYDETVMQYLRPPFEFFGMELTVDFCIQEGCVTQLIFKDPVCY